MLNSYVVLKYVLKIHIWPVAWAEHIKKIHVIVKILNSLFTYYMQAC